jgi:aspartate/tyrosine/aromatic aminotransferase
MHKNIQQVIWNSPDGQRRNHNKQEVERKILRMYSVVARYGAEIGSDHSLVISKLRQNLRKDKNYQRDTSLNIQQLRDPLIKRNFQLEVRNRFSTLMEQDESDFEQTHSV